MIEVVHKIRQQPDGHLVKPVGHPRPSDPHRQRRLAVRDVVRLVSAAGSSCRARNLGGGWNEVSA